MNDKIFALFGMRSDARAVTSAGLSVDYSIFWNELISNLTHLWLGASSKIGVLEGGRKLNTRAKGLALGRAIYVEPGG